VTTFKIRDDALDWIEAGDEIIALDRRSASYLSANSSAALLWRRLVAGATRRGLVEELVNTFDIDEERAVADVKAFLAQLEGAGLLATAGP